MPELSLAAKVEKAFQTLLAAAIIDTETQDWTHYTGTDDQEQVAPATVSQCIGGPEEPLNSGNRNMTVEVTVRTKLTAADPENPDEDRATVHNENVRLVEEVLCRDDLAAALSPLVDNFYVFDPVITLPSRQDVDGDFARTVFGYRTYCCASDLT